MGYGRRRILKSTRKKEFRSCRSSGVLHSKRFFPGSAHLLELFWIPGLVFVNALELNVDVEQGHAELLQLLELLNSF